MHSLLETVSEPLTTGAPKIETSKALACPLCSTTDIAKFLEAPDRFHLRNECHRLMRCRSCRCVWTIEPPAPSEMWQHYTEDYHRAIVSAGEGSAADRWRGQVQCITSQKHSGSILDLGCSSGGFLSTMPKDRWKLFGIEMEESTAQRARTLTGAEVFGGDILDAPFAPASFDVITCFDVIEHVYDPSHFLLKVHEWLKPGGIFYAMMPNIDSWESRLFGTYWFGLELPRHLFHFSPRSLRYVLKALNFEEVSVTTPPISYIERSSGYVFSRLVEAMGLSPTAQAKGRSRRFGWRLVRKTGRTVLINPFAHLAALAGAGPCLEVVFRRPAR